MVSSYTINSNNFAIICDIDWLGHHNSYCQLLRPRYGTETIYKAHLLHTINNTWTIVITMTDESLQMV
jgi:hypothetical protein